MKNLMLKSALFLAALSIGFSGELAVWQPTSVTSYETSITSTATFGWMSEQVTSANNRWVLPESSARAYAGATGVSTADAMFSSYWVGETPVSSYVNNTPIPTANLFSGGTTLEVFGGTSSYSSVYNPASSTSSISNSVSSNVVASNYNFGSSNSSFTSYGTPLPSGSSSSSSGGLVVFGGTENLYTNPFLSSGIRRFDSEPIPEPGTYLLVGGSLVGLAMLRKRMAK